MIIIKIYTKIEISNSSDSEEFGKIFSDFDKKLTQTFGEKSIGGYHLTNTAYKELSENEDFLKKLVIGEISVLVICAYTIIALILFLQQNKSGDFSNMFDFHTLSYVAIFLFLFTAVTSIIPMIRISKLSPKDLLGGRE